MTGCEIMIHSPRIALVSALELVLLALLLLKARAYPERTQKAWIEAEKERPAALEHAEHDHCK